jgi:integrase
MREKHYVERNGKIYARAYYRDLNSGKWKQVWRKVETKTQAREVVNQVRQQLKDGTEAFENKDTLDAYLDVWLEAHEVSTRTIEDYASLLKHHVRPHLGKKKLGSIKPLDVQQVVNGMAAKNLSPRTIRYTITVLRNALQQAVRWGVLLKNPAEDLQLPKQMRREMKCLTPKQAKQFLRFARKDKYGVLFEVAIVTGMRPEEYLGLRWSDVDIVKQTVTVQRTLVWRRQKVGWYFGEPKTNKSRRTIPLTEKLVKDLTKLRRKQNERRLKLGSKWTSLNLVFPSDLGTPLSVRNLDRRHFKQILIAAKLPDIRLYDLRHTCATLLLAAGENPKVVSERLGHSSIVLTLDCYCHVLPTMQENATRRLASLLG